MQRVIDLISRVNRPGVDRIIEHIKNSDFATAKCGRHHLYPGGLVDHTLEVYNFMKSYRPNMPEESIIICAVMHDIDKAKVNGKSFGKHPNGTVLVAKRCGLALTEDEKFAILKHHSTKLSDICSHYYRKVLTKADMQSTGKWRRENVGITFKDIFCEIIAATIRV
jgi:predicted hydrolase (HD superfamily)